MEIFEKSKRFQVISIEHDGEGYGCRVDTWEAEFDDEVEAKKFAKSQKSKCYFSTVIDLLDEKESYLTMSSGDSW